jgi:hypothetical protein
MKVWHPVNPSVLETTGFTYVLSKYLLQRLHNSYIQKYTITQQASYIFRPFSVIFREVFDKQKHNIGYLRYRRAIAELKTGAKFE